METNHTKGEWEARGSSVYLKNETFCIANVITHLSRQHEAEANAKLLASSPELLEALKPFMEFAQEFLHNNELRNGRPKEGAIYTIDFTGTGGKSITVEMLKNAVSAINKATC